jgi:hypothetical protein
MVSVSESFTRVDVNGSRFDMGKRWGVESVFAIQPFSPLFLPTNRDEQSSSTSGMVKWIILSGDRDRKD